MKLKRRLLAAGLLAAVVSTAASAAFASSTISVGGASSPAADVPVTGSLSGTISFLTDYGTPMSCSTAVLGGYVKRGSSLASGTKIGAVTSASFGTSNGCAATGLNYPFIVQKSAKSGSPAEWAIHLVGTPAKGSASAAIELRNVAMKIHSTGLPRWSIDLEATGTVPGTLTQGATPQIKITPTAGVFPLALQAFDGSGANVPAVNTFGGQIYTGDKMQLTGTFNLSTPVTW